jgi:hypothetical protein
MRFTVTWHPSAEQELADIWLQSTDRSEITQAANSLGHLLSSDPLAQGEEFYGAEFWSSFRLLSPIQ